MPILHQKMLLVTYQLLPFLLPLLDYLIYDHLLSKYQKHWLVDLEEALDLTPLEQGCAGYHRGSGKGAAVFHPVRCLVRAVLVKYLFNLSYRQTEEKIDRDLLVKWFVGYSLFAKPPDHTTLQRFEIWVLTHQPHLFFDTLLSQIKGLDPQDWRSERQLVDTFAMLARAAKGRLIPLIRQACQKLIATLQAADPQRAALILTALDQVALFGQVGDKPTRALSAEERAERLQQVVNQALLLHRLVTASLAQKPLPAQDHLALETWLDRLHKIIFDETDVTPSADAETPDTAPPLTVTERPNGKKGTYRIVNLNDPDASFRHHGADKGEAAKNAFNASLLTGTIYIHWTQADTGARPDNEALPDLLLAQYDHFGFFPLKVVGDQIYGYGKVRATVDQTTFKIMN